MSEDARRCGLLIVWLVVEVGEVGSSGISKDRPRTPVLLSRKPRPPAADCVDEDGREEEEEEEKAESWV